MLPRITLPPSSTLGARAACPVGLALVQHAPAASVSAVSPAVGSGLTAVFNLDPECHGRRPPPPSQGIVSDAREARHVRRRWPRLRPRRTVSWVAEPVREVSVAPADEAIVVLGMERALRLLPVVRPRSLNVVEIVEAANACTRSSHLTAEGRLYDLGDALGVPRGITRYPASGNAAPRQALGRWRLDILAVTRS